MFDFIDNLNPSVFKHIVMLYEEPEYARLAQIRFMHNGLKNGELVVYTAQDDENINFTINDMRQTSMEVDRYLEEGRLQFHVQKRPAYDRKSFLRVGKDLRKAIESRFQNAKYHATALPDRIRVIGNMLPYVFAEAVVDQKTATGQLLVEKLFQSEFTDSFDGIVMCVYQINDIAQKIDEPWMNDLLTNHDAVLFLTKFSNGFALDIR